MPGVVRWRSDCRAAAFVLLLLVPGVAGAACRDDTVELRGEWGTARFTTEVADEAAERAQGLMHRQSMPRSAGMLFVYPGPRTANFWMRNTLIPLDIIFADSSGVVQSVHHDAQPLDETRIFGGHNIQYVLEVNGGLARTIGIAEGTQLRHPSIAQDTAAWGCDE
ncbi:MAG: DUF192 domain-containing protein [Pseudomonadota bacterium]